MPTNLDILLIEDQADDRELISHLLNKHMEDIHITCEHNKKDVIDIISNKNFDLIITDYHLEGFTGIDLIDDIRGFRGFETPIIMITGDASENVTLNALQHGVDDFVLKTLDGIRELPEVIRRTLKRADIHKIKYTTENRVLSTDEIFQNLFENSSELIFTIWPDASFVNVNEATLKVLGIDRKAAGNRNFVEFVDSEYRGPFKSALDRLLKNKEHIEIELLLRNADNKKINVIGSGNPHFVNGKVIATNWIFRNITPEKYMESLLWDDYKQYSGVFNHVPVAIFLSDHRGVILQANRPAARLLGYPLAELQGMQLSEITHPDDIEMSIEYHRQLMEGKLTQYTFEKRYRTKSGDIVWVELSASMVRNSKGEPMYAIAHVKDITELRHFEDLLGKLAYDLTTVNGEYIFDRLSSRLIESLNSDFVFVSYIAPDASILTLLFRDRNAILQEHDFTFPGNLLRDLVSDDELIIIDRLTRKGRIINTFEEQSASDVVAIPLRSGDGRVIGILGTIFKNTTKNHSMITSVLRIAGSKITSQILEQELALKEDKDNNTADEYSIN